MLLICYYATVFRVQRENRWYIAAIYKMHQFPFAQKFPGLQSTSFPSPPLNVQFTLSGGKVNMSTAPNYMQLETCTSQTAFGAWYGSKVCYKKHKILRCSA